MYDEGQVVGFARDEVHGEAVKNIDRPEDEECLWANTQPREYASRYELVRRNSSSGYQEYGRGAWSVVFRAGEISTSGQSEVVAPGIPTPPASPLAAASQVGGQDFRCLAVKKPTRRDGRPILFNEARILTYLHQAREGREYIVPFHGYEPLQHSIILDAIPLTLESFSKSAAKHARETFSTRTMFDPVIGVPGWLRLCRALIDGLGFLHSRQVVHGDIKPANILLRAYPAEQADDVVEYEPLYCDFSSSHVDEPEKDPGEVSAVTTEFTAPELLQALSRKVQERAFATFENDVFALGVTLLVAATGESPYLAARFHGQMTAMAREGMPLEFARRGEQGSRVGVGKMVDMVVHGAVDKSRTKRWTIGQWQGIMTEIPG